MKTNTKNDECRGRALDYVLYGLCIFACVVGLPMILLGLLGAEFADKLSGL